MATKKHTIELECPGCAELLELDAGFSGGVCRCFSCGTLMTVPADPAHERAERLSRPDRPDRPDAPPGATPRPQPRPGVQAPSAVRPPSTVRPPSAVRPSTPATPSAQRPSTPRSTAAEADTFITASGKVVRLSDVSVPVARQRKVVRYTTVAVFWSVLGIIVIGCLVAAVIVLKSLNQDESSNNNAALGYDPKVNLLTPQSSGFMGRAWAPTQAVALDLTGGSAGWWSIVAPRLNQALAKLPAGARMQVVINTSTGPKSAPDAPATLDPALRSRIETLLKLPAPAGGAETDVPALLKAATAGDPARVLLITSRKTDAKQVDALAKALAGHEKVRLDVIQIDHDSPELRNLAQKQRGTYLSLPQKQLILWDQQVIE